tara:strand:+ start:200 stop:349 length:150 start_codon:yes stop_codon:yes gene_type:complete
MSEETAVTLSEERILNSPSPVEEEYRCREVKEEAMSSLVRKKTPFSVPW